MKRHTVAAAAAMMCALLATILLDPALSRADAPDDHEPIIIDNEDGEDGEDVGLFTMGEWRTESNPAGQHGPTYLHDGNLNKGACAASYTPRLPLAGYYQVDLRWTGGDDHSDHVPVDVVHADGTLRTHVDQTKGGVWFPLGVHRFEAGIDGGVVIRNEGTVRTVIVDAVRFVYAGAAIVDNAEIGAIETTGDWAARPEQDNSCYGNDQLRTQPDGSGEAMAAFTPEIAEDGDYEVWLWWGREGDLATNVPVFIEHDGVTDTVVIDQRTFGDAWLRLGIFHFAADGEARVTIRTDSVNGYVVADAMMVLPYTAYRAEAARARLTKDFPPLGPVPVTPIRLMTTDGGAYRVTLIAFSEDALVIRDNGVLIGVPTDTITTECLFTIYREYADPGNPDHEQALVDFLADRGMSQSARAELLATQPSTPTTTQAAKDPEDEPAAPAGVSTAERQLREQVSRFVDAQVAG